MSGLLLAGILLILGGAILCILCIWLFLDSIREVSYRAQEKAYQDYLTRTGIDLDL